ncbi:hypothetical protein CARUB_v10021892mg, partial [Capsella rubella]
MKEKTGKIKRRTQSSSTMSSSRDKDTSQSQYIPLELTIEILLRLPARSMVRFRSVSKLWSATTTSQEFLNSFSTRSLSLQPSVLLTVRKKDTLFVFSSPLNKTSPFSCLGSYRFRDLRISCHQHYMHGLIFLEGSKQLAIWNPTMKRSITIPKPKASAEGRYYKECIFGYDLIEGNYIVLRICEFRDYSKIFIFTLGAQGQLLRKIIKNGVPQHRRTNHCGKCINGVMYYEALVHLGVGNVERRIMSFDIRSKKVNSIKYPNTCVCDHLVLYEGRLTIVTFKYLPTPSIDLWILKNEDRHEWTHKGFVLPLADMDPIQRQDLRFCGVSDAGEFIFAPWRLSESFYIVYFDLRINGIREVLCEGSLGKEFGCGNGLGLGL